MECGRKTGIDAQRIIMTLLQFAMILICVVVLSIGQLLFKYSARTLPDTDSAAVLLTLASNPWFLLALLLYGGATLLWVWILREVPLTLAYPFIALSFVIVPLVSGTILGEQVDIAYWIGICLIVAGISVTAF